MTNTIDPKVDERMTSVVKRMFNRQGVKDRKRFEFLTECIAHELDMTTINRLYGTSIEILPNNPLYHMAHCNVYFVGETCSGMYYAAKFERAWVRIVVDSSLNVHWNVINDPNMYLGKDGYPIS